MFLKSKEQILSQTKTKQLDKSELVVSEFVKSCDVKIKKL